MYDKFGQHINGKWIKSSGNETHDVINPANEELIGKASKANKKDIDLALKSSQKALRNMEKYITLGKIKSRLGRILKL